MPGGHRRTTSEFIETSITSNFVHRPGFWIMYAFLVLGAWVTLRTLFMQLDAATIWTITLQAHAVISFILLHWIRGTPESSLGQPGEDVAHLTFWEQIDGGKFFGTPTRRFFTLMPIAIFFLSLIWTQENLAMLACNSVSTLLLIVAKMEALFGARLFGLNKD